MSAEQKPLPFLPDVPGTTLSVKDRLYIHNTALSVLFASVQDLQKRVSALENAATGLSAAVKESA